MSRIPEREDLQRALAARHGRAVQEKFNQATVAICGLGGLGSNIAIALARAGVGRLILTDFDRVDITNLHRQQYKATQLGEFKTEALAANLREIAPYLTIETHTTAITEENFEEILAPADVICEAFDNAEAKAMLVNGCAGKITYEISDRCVRHGRVRLCKQHPNQKDYRPFLSLRRRNQRCCR